MTDSLIPTEDQERQMQAFKDATADCTRVLVQRKRRTGLAVQFHPDHPLTIVNPAGSTPPLWEVFGVPVAPGDYIVNVSGEGIRVVSRLEFENEWEVVGDA